MQNYIEEIGEKILSNSMDKKLALKNFEELTEVDKKLLVGYLKNKLSVTQNKNVEDGLNNKKYDTELKAVDQRELTDANRAYIKELSDQYEKFMPKSKKIIIDNQEHFVDQRRPFHLIKDLKSMHFQLTYKNAEGAYVYDIDGNKYVDISGDMGVNIFGHKPKFIIDAVKEALDRGVPLAGYSEMIFKTTKLFCEITDNERMVFTQSGTEAVMFAVRLARAATNKKKIVIFEGSYHGMSDAVVATGDRDGKSVSIGPGMLQEFADQIIVLEYGNMDHLEIIEKNAKDIAGVLVEPVQSRHPYKKPIEFLHELRKITLELDIALIVDEMITGLRVCHRGAQGFFKFKGDISTYGKIPGGGMPTGIVAGSSKYLDLVDGGTWNFDDDSMPKGKRTGLAGTHTQNPLKVAASFATLSEIKKRCEDLNDVDNCKCFQSELNKKTEMLANDLNDYFKLKRVPITIDNFGSLFRFRFIDSYWGITEALFFILLRMNGVETNIQGNCFLTTAHSDEDIDFVIKMVKKSLDTLLENSFFKEVEVKEDVVNKKKVTEKKISIKQPKNENGLQMEKIKELIKVDLYSLAEIGE